MGRWADTQVCPYEKPLLVESEELGEVARKAFFDGVHRRRFCKELGHRGDAFVANTAGHDPAEVLQVGGDVEGDAVGRDAAPVHLDADSRDLGVFAVAPDPGPAVSGNLICAYVEISQCANKHLLKFAHVSGIIYRLAVLR